MLLELLLVGRLVLGADQSMRGPAAIGREVEVTVGLADHLLEMIASILLGPESMHRFAGIVQESLQLAAFKASALDRGRAAEVGRFLRGPSREPFQLLSARGEPARHGRAGFLEVSLEPGAKAH